MNKILYFLPFLGGAILVFANWRANWIKKQDAGEAKMVEISQYIAQGATSFLKAVYRVIIPFALVIAFFLLLISSFSTRHSHPLIAVPFLTGAFTSAAAGWIGMKVATH